MTEGLHDPSNELAQFCTVCLIVNQSILQSSKVVAEDLRSPGKESPRKQETQLLQRSKDWRQGTEEKRLHDLSPSENQKDTQNKAQHGLYQTQIFVPERYRSGGRVGPSDARLREMPAAQLHSNYYPCKGDTVIETRAIVCWLRVNAHKDDYYQDHQRDLFP